MRLNSPNLFRGFLAAAFCSLVGIPVFAQQKQVFSGPQPGEKLPALKVKGVFGDDAGKDFDYVQLAGGKPTVLIFMHKLTRPAAMVSRMIMTYCGKKKREDLFAGIVYLTDDVTAATQRLKRAQRALVPNKVMRFGISPDGAEGPGAYGLNRKMTLTILVADKGKVTANFPLIQPGPQADVLKVLKAVVKLTGDEMPKLADLGGPRRRPARNRKRPKRAQDPNLRAYLAPVIQKTATDEEVDSAVKKLEAYLKKNPATRVQVGEIARRIIKAGVLSRYGTRHAQEHIKRWAKEFTAPKSKTTDKKPRQ